MKRKFSIGLIMVSIVIGVSAYSISTYSISKEPAKKTDTIITDKNGKVVEPISGDNDNIGHQ
jgi:hypothetical protein